MNPSQLLIVVIVVAVVAIAIIAYAAMRKRRSRHLRERFGPEYERVVRNEGGVRQGEGVLEFREKRREKLKIRPLSPTDRSSFLYRLKMTSLIGIGEECEEQQQDHRTRSNNQAFAVFSCHSPIL